MNKKQTARDQGNQRGNNFMVENDDTLKTNPVYVMLKNSFNAYMAEVAAAKLKQYEMVTPVTQDKLHLFDVVVQTVHPLSIKAAAQAFTLNEIGLSVSLDHPVVYLSMASDEDLIGRSTILRNIMNDNIATLTQIAPDDITAMDTAINDFVVANSLPKTLIKQKKSEGTDPIPGLLDQIDEVKHQIGNIIQSAFPSLYNTWKSEIKVGTPEGVRKLSLVMQYFTEGSNAPLANITTSVSDGITASKVKSSALGYSRFYGLTSGSYSITSEHPAFITESLHNVSIADNAIMRLTINLQKATLKGTLEIRAYDNQTLQPLSGVLFSVTKIDYQQTTGDNGRLTTPELLPDIYTATLSLTGYKRIDFTFIIESSKQISLEFGMDKL